VSLAGPGDPGRDEGQDRDAGAAPAAWRDEGFSDEQRQLFQRWRFGLAEAIAWRQAGVPDGLRAAQWVTAGVTPGTVDQWRAAGIDAGQAVHWHEMGFDLQAARDARRRGLTPDAAFASQHRTQPSGPPSGGGFSMVMGPGGGRGQAAGRLFELGLPPRLIHGYLSRNWDVDEALPWAKAGLEAADASLWRALGLTPAEAGRLARKGANPVDTVRDWWRAGIPFDEVADWIGAGLSPQEAAAQRARGITAEQAAALRALRDQDADD
jgi:hypothetical protein